MENKAFEKEDSSSSSSSSSDGEALKEVEVEEDDRKEAPPAASAYAAAASNGKMAEVAEEARNRRQQHKRNQVGSSFFRSKQFFIHRLTKMRSASIAQTCKRLSVIVHMQTQNHFGKESALSLFSICENVANHFNTWTKSASRLLASKGGGGLSLSCIRTATRFSLL